MKKEAVDALECKDGLIYVDCTLGGGGHSEYILQQISPNGRLIAFDIDDDAIAAAKTRLANYNNITIVKDSYANIKSNLEKLGIEKITGGIIFDLGASYHQLTKAERGFSFMKDAPLDMRFNKDASFSAYDVVNNYSENDLIRIFSEYGEERFSKRIAKHVKIKWNSLLYLSECSFGVYLFQQFILKFIYKKTRVYFLSKLRVFVKLKQSVNCPSNCWHICNKFFNRRYFSRF
jgi:16S rRNA (cytosine(1402)-N(4))-methyltransferase